MAGCVEFFPEICNFNIICDRHRLLLVDISSRETSYPSSTTRLFVLMGHSSAILHYLKFSFLTYLYFRWVIFLTKNSFPRVLWLFLQLGDLLSLNDHSDMGVAMCSKAFLVLVQRRFYSVRRKCLLRIIQGLPQHLQKEPSPSELEGSPFLPRKPHLKLFPHTNLALHSPSRWTGSSTCCGWHSCAENTKCPLFSLTKTLAETKWSKGNFLKHLGK